jgi:hypothetical protein
VFAIELNNSSIRVVIRSTSETINLCSLIGGTGMQVFLIKDKLRFGCTPPNANDLVSL